MIIYSAFVKHLRKKWEYNKAMHHLFTDFKKAYDSIRRKVLYNILIEFGIPMKLVKIIKMCLDETYNRVWVGKNLSDMFPIRNGDALLPLLFNFALECTIRVVQINQNGLKLNGTHQLLVYADDVNRLGGSMHTIKKNTEALIVASKETGLEVNADKTNYKGMSQDQNARRCHKMKTDNRAFEMVKEFKYLGTTLTNQNSIQEELKSRLKSRNASYNSVQHHSYLSLLSKNLEINI